MIFQVCFQAPQVAGLFYCLKTTSNTDLKSPAATTNPHIPEPGLIFLTGCSAIPEAAP
jgi:hypothetical protein